MAVDPLLKMLGQKLLGGAAQGAVAQAMDVFKQAQEGSMKLFVVFQTPDGKMQHMRILMSREDAMKACVQAHREMKKEIADGTKAKGGGGLP